MSAKLKHAPIPRWFMYILLAQRRHIFLEKWYFYKKNWELTVYVQVYLFIILYSYWIATNIIQYLLYLVVFVSEYLSVFTQLYLRKWHQLLYQRIMQPFFRSTRTFHWEGGTPILRHSRKVPEWWPPFLWWLIRFGPYCMVQPDPIDPHIYLTIGNHSQVCDGVQMSQ